MQKVLSRGILTPSALTLSYSNGYMELETRLKVYYEVNGGSDSQGHDGIPFAP